MLVTKLSCPHCRAALKCGKAVPAGKAIACPKCQKQFAVGMEQAPNSPGEKPVSPHRETILDSAADTSVGVKRPPLATSAPPKPANWSAPARKRAVAIWGGAACVLSACLIGCLMLFPGDSPKEVTIAETPSPPLVPLAPPSLPELNSADAPVPPPPTALVNKTPPPAKELPKNEAEPPPVSPEPMAQVAAVPDKIVPGVSRGRINEAIDKGVDYLKRTQKESGSWIDPRLANAVGFAGLPGLTMLECRVPSTESAIQKTAVFIRNQCAELRETYSLSLAILFLDRLGEPGDRPLIQTLAMRLAAGQTSAGGWDYTCPILSDSETKTLLEYLDGLNKDRKDGKQTTQPVDFSSRMKRMPVVVNQHKPREQMVLTETKDDNSNSQFALLALWAARRHQVASDPVLLVAYQRYEKSQNFDGGWGYHFADKSKDSMTCVGLLGLALGHAVDHAARKGKGVASAIEDPIIGKGLQALGKAIGTPLEEGKPAMDNLYFLWSVERVAMLYKLETIGTKDWYSWGAQIILTHQRPEGYWVCQRYHGSVPLADSCFALLFLRRSNLVQDLTDSLGQFLAITDPGAKQN